MRTAIPLTLLLVTYLPLPAQERKDVPEPGVYSVQFTIRDGDENAQGGRSLHHVGRRWRQS